MSTVADTDVLIVGAGPVGLFLANECARRRLRWRLIEKRATQSEHSKALAIFPRTLEIFDMAGLAERFLAVANRVTAVAIETHGHRIATMHFEPQGTPYPFVAMVPQDVTERLLCEALSARGGHVDYCTSFVSAEPQEGGVLVRMDRSGTAETVRASFVVGCDGAHSSVRHAADVGFEGGEYADLFLLADVATNDTLSAAEMQLCPNEHGPVAIFPMGPTRRRIVGTIAEAIGEAPTLELVQRILAERGPPGLEARALHWSSYFRVHHRLAETLRIGCIFLAGDAAHIHSPFGGQGMNTGLHDVWNLAWKIDLCLRGHANARLLESYGAERLPVIKGVIGMTDLMTKVMGTPNRFAQALRNTVIPMVSRLAPFQHAFVERLSELGIAYGGSPIIEGDGRRYFDETIRGGSGIGSRFILFVGKDAPPRAREAAAALCTGLGDLTELRDGAGEDITLVRPDGYVACVVRRPDTPSALAPLRTLIESQITPGSADQQPRHTSG
ncbi:MAG TPA: FAD-dependent monooxygenase [Steroidobacteraceae bacterium]|nr:FAD-dependent monooxygenase [Steroidobacteraceae bacterium]